MSEFKKGHVIWAKIRGYPWWPGVVAFVDPADSDKEETRITVNFIGENSHAELAESKVLNFSKNLKQLSKTKKKDLLQSIQTAKSILAGSITYEESMKKNKGRVRVREEVKLEKKRQAPHSREFTEEEEVKKKKKKGRFPSNTIISSSGSESKSHSLSVSEQSSSKNKTNTVSHLQTLKQGIIKSAYNLFKLQIEINDIQSANRNELSTAQLKTIQKFIHAIQNETPEIIEKEIDSIQQAFILLFKLHINIQQLAETKIGTTIKRFAKFCESSKDLGKIQESSANLIQKWESSTLQGLFDDTEPLVFSDFKPERKSKLNLSTHKLGLGKGKGRNYEFKQFANFAKTESEDENSNESNSNLDLKRTSKIEKDDEKSNDEKEEETGEAHVEMENTDLITHKSNHNNTNNNNDEEEKEKVCMKENREKRVKTPLVNPLLRKKVCQRLAKLIQEKSQFSKDHSQGMSLRLEESLRKADPLMKDVYKNKVVALINSVKREEGGLKEEVLLQIANED